MIQTLVGDALLHPDGLIVHGCNCQGVMGSGFALAVKKRYPHVYQEYVRRHKETPWQLGEVQIIEVGPSKYICNAMTQVKYGPGGRRYVEYFAIEECFWMINQVANALQLDVIFPKIGAGLAGGDWEIISGIIDEVVTAPKILYVLE